MNLLFECTALAIFPAIDNELDEVRWGFEIGVLKRNEALVEDGSD
jgi:hypothetical protein